MCKVYGDKCVVGTIRCWVWQFQQDGGGSKFVWHREQWLLQASLCDMEGSDCYRQVCVTWRAVTATGKFVWHGGQWLLLQASLCDMEGSDCCYRQVCVTWRAVTATGKSLEKHIEEKVLQLTQKAIWKANNNNNNNNNSITNKWAETDDVLFQQSNYT